MLADGAASSESASSHTARSAAASSRADFPRPTELAADDFRRNHPRFQGENFQQNLDLRRGARPTSSPRERGCTPAQLALAWVLSRGDDRRPDSRHEAPDLPRAERRRFRASS